MALLNYVFHANVTGIKDYLLKLRDFAVAQGWTEETYLTNVQWQSGSGFVAGTEDFLQLSTTGYGAQSIFIRLRAENTGTDSESEWLQMGAHKNNTFDLGSSTHPVQRDGSGNANWNTNRYTSYHPTNIPELWIFGNDKFIFSVAKHSTTICVFQMFGSIEHYDTTQTQGDIATTTSNSTLSTFKWYNASRVTPLDHTVQYVYFQNGLVATVNSGFDFYYSLSGGVNNYVRNRFYNSGRVVESPNSFSEVRTPIKQVMFLKDVAGDGLWFEMGTCWIYRYNVEGLTIGEKVTFGTEEYLCFPNPSTPNTTAGIAIKIAE